MMEHTKLQWDDERTTQIRGKTESGTVATVRLEADSRGALELTWHVQTTGDLIAYGSIAQAKIDGATIDHVTEAVRYVEGLAKLRAWHVGAVRKEEPPHLDDLRHANAMLLRGLDANATAIEFLKEQALRERRESSASLERLMARLLERLPELDEGVRKKVADWIGFEFAVEGARFDGEGGIDGD